MEQDYSQKVAQKSEINFTSDEESFSEASNEQPSLRESSRASNELQRSNQLTVWQILAQILSREFR
jgi:hypothetical protein